jgi:hypothetical protein
MKFLGLFAAVFVAAMHCGHVAAQITATASVATFRSISTSQSQISLAGYDSVGDGGGGLFVATGGSCVVETPTG